MPIFLGGASYCFRGFEGVYWGGVTDSKNYNSISLWGYIGGSFFDGEGREGGL